MTAERKKMIYLEPERFTSITPEDWNSYVYSTEPDGYTKGTHMDLSVIAPIADAEADGAWRNSKLDSVKEYLLKQINN